MTFIPNRELKRRDPAEIVAEVLADKPTQQQLTLRLMESFEGHGYRLDEVIDFICEARKKVAQTG
jgi:hypothetical protein